MADMADSSNIDSSWRNDDEKTYTELTAFQPVEPLQFNVPPIVDNSEHDTRRPIHFQTTKDPSQSNSSVDVTKKRMGRPPGSKDSKKRKTTASSQNMITPSKGASKLSRKSSSTTTSKPSAKPSSSATSKTASSTSSGRSTPQTPAADASPGRSTPQTPAAEAPPGRSTPQTSAADAGETAPSDVDDLDEIEEEPERFEDHYVEVGAPNETDDNTETGGWTNDAIRLLCEYHIPRMTTYNSGELSAKRNHWKKAMEAMQAAGFKSDTFSSNEKISRKWRYIYGQYKAVKDNNGKTGRGKLKFKYYDLMNEIIVDNNIASAVINPEFVEAGDGVEVTIRARGDEVVAKEKKSHKELMRDIQTDYNTKSLEIQERALQIELKKFELLKKLLEK